MQMAGRVFSRAGFIIAKIFEGIENFREFALSQTHGANICLDGGQNDAQGDDFPCRDVLLSGCLRTVTA